MSSETPELPDLSDAPEVPVEAEFSVIAFEWAWHPHPYMLSRQHVNYAAAHRHGEITDEVIRQAEAEGGAVCDLCATTDKRLPFDEHRKVIGMVIRPEVDKTPNYLAGLKEWLNQNEYIIRNELKAEMLLFAKYQPRIVRKI
jgi:hypothetical protein